jgi:hypothetical protein
MESITLKTPVLELPMGAWFVSRRVHRKSQCLRIPQKGKATGRVPGAASWKAFPSFSVLRPSLWRGGPSRAAANLIARLRSTPTALPRRAGLPRAGPPWRQLQPEWAPAQSGLSFVRANLFSG